MWKVISGVVLGWGLGANDAANVFGTGVATGAVRYRTAVLLTALFVLIGAVLEGSKTMDVVGKMTSLNLNTAFIASLSAGITVIILTLLKLPVSTSQAIMGAIIGTGLCAGKPIEWDKFFGKVLPAWVLTPIGGAVIGFLLYRFIGSIVEKYAQGRKSFDIAVSGGLIVAGSYGAYALGANNVANATGVFVGAGILTPLQASVIGGLSIGLGVITFSKGVMFTVGKKISSISPFAGFIAVLSEAITVHIFTQIGVPVSTSQAVVGAVAGVGIVKGMKAVNFKTLSNIAIGWVSTPTAAGIVSFVLSKLIS